MTGRDIIHLIDEATGCHQCHRPLGDSPSNMFCSEGCQWAWQSARVSGRPEVRDRNSERRPLSHVFIQRGEGTQWVEVGTAAPFTVPTPDVPQGTWDIRPVAATFEFTCTYFNRELWEQMLGPERPEETP